MAVTMKYSPRDEQQLISKMLSPEIADDKLAWVLFTFPWGKESTPLAQADGPRKWQREELIQETEHLLENRERIRQGQPPIMLKKAICSGRGPGKSAKTGWRDTSNMPTTSLGSAPISRGIGCSVSRTSIPGISRASSR